jgi:hypothetical protein
MATDALDTGQCAGEPEVIAPGVLAVGEGTRPSFHLGDRGGVAAISR